MTHRDRSLLLPGRALGQNVLTVVEAWALAIWVGALVGFAFIFAPIAFRTIADLDLFATLTARVLGTLAGVGYVCGAAVIAASLLQALRRHNPRREFVRAIIVAAMLALVTYETRAVVPDMETTAGSFHAPFASIAKSDPRRIRYDALHRRSSLVYGAVLVLGFAAIALTAVRHSKS